MNSSIQEIFKMLLENAYINDLPDLHLASNKYPFIRDKSWELKEIKSLSLKKKILI